MQHHKDVGNSWQKSNKMQNMKADQMEMKILIKLDAFLFCVNNDIRSIEVRSKMSL